MLALDGGSQAHRGVGGPCGVMSTLDEIETNYIPLSPGFSVLLKCSQSQEKKPPVSKADRENNRKKEEILLLRQAWLPMG